ncbi:hypothetical protein Q604_UNBC06040G0001, partial [human gut metagenome]
EITFIVTHGGEVAVSHPRALSEAILYARALAVQP